jgi:hypothetical protein
MGGAVNERTQFNRAAVDLVVASGSSRALLDKRTCACECRAASTDSAGAARRAGIGATRRVVLAVAAVATGRAYTVGCRTAAIASIREAGKDWTVLSSERPQPVRVIRHLRDVPTRRVRYVNALRASKLLVLEVRRPPERWGTRTATVSHGELTHHRMPGAVSTLSVHSQTLLERTLTSPWVRTSRCDGVGHGLTAFGSAPGSPPPARTPPRNPRTACLAACTGACTRATRTWHTP